MNEFIIGIDLGTTNSEVAVLKNHKIMVLEPTPGQLALPSYVGLDAQGTLLVGETAKNQYLLHPERTVKSIKRKMGQSVKVTLGDQTYTPQAIASFLLKHLKNTAEAYLQHPISKAVVTVPAYFTDAQKQATREAGQLADLEIVRLLHEPTAAALAYKTEHRTNKQVLIYDFGGGTFDVSIAHIHNDTIKILSTHGHPQLGGDDFDQKIIDYILNHLQNKYAIDPRQSQPAMAKITRIAEIAKRTLSYHPYVLMQEEFLTEQEGIPIHLSLELSREQYEILIREPVEQTLESTLIALRDAQLKVSDIHEVLLVGGSTRTPLIGQRLAELFRQPPRCEIHPDLCVAMGAALQGALIHGNSPLPTRLVDITPYSFGIYALKEMEGEIQQSIYIPIIARNTPLPIQKTEVFYTVLDNQEAVDIPIFQGENPLDPNNIKLGEFSVEGLSAVPHNNPILVTFSLDVDGVLEVTAIEKQSGLQKTVTVNQAIAFEQNSETTVNQRLNTIFEEITEISQEKVIAEPHHLIIQAQALVEKAGRLLSKVSSENQEDMMELVNQITQAIANKQFKTLSTLIEQLSDILYYVDS